MVKIVEKDIAGARASNAGDRFHELWALRKALSLLEPNSPYQAISVEGVPCADGSPTSGTWSAVDVCLMSGGTSLGEADRAEFAQLKYSTANPNAPWTVARLSSNSAKKGNNSVVRKLAEAYTAAESTRSDQNNELSYSIKLVSNQPISTDVLIALGKCTTPGATATADAERDRTILRKAAGLSKEKFQEFAAKLDFSECGAQLLFEQEDKAIRALDRLIEGDTRPWRLELLRLISDAMLPSASREPITEEVLLARLEIGTEYALYPCPNRVAPVSSLIERAVTRNLVTTLVTGTQRLGIHGGAGCGKTTTIHQLAEFLPLGSICLQYDCYGGGSYLDDSAPRHRPVEAFTQLSNEVASRIRVPRLLRISERGNPAKAFKERLVLGAEILRESAPQALLVIAVDAADNAVAAAQKRGDHCFVRELASMADLPQNVRIVISARTARLAQLELPPTFSYQQIDPFNFDETLEYARTFVAAPDIDWVREFHTLTRGTPRVQAYAFELSTTPKEAIQFLLPGGKDLSQIFEQAVMRAWQKGGEPGPIAVLCAALISLPRPVPVENLAQAIGTDLIHTTDLCEDLNPTLKIERGLVSFSDEDFEDFVAERGKGELQKVQARIAEHLLANANCDAYAANHVVQSLITAKREQDALRVAIQEPEASLFSDPVKRRLCHLERMRSALRVCSQTGNVVETLTLLLTGAEALRTSDAIARELALNPDLAARYARESVDRLVLADEKYVQANGPILCHYMAQDAKTLSFALVERSRRLFIAWQTGTESRRGHSQHSQHLTAGDIAAFCRAEVATSGLGTSLRIFRRLRHDRYPVFKEFAACLLGHRDFETLERLLSEPRLPSLAKAHLTCMLAKAGRRIDLASAATLLNRLYIRRAIAGVDSKHGGRTAELRGCALELCEVLVRSGGRADIVRQVLTSITQGRKPRWQYLTPSNYIQLDAFLRAECLLAELAEELPNARHLLNIADEEIGSWSSESGISYQEHQKRSDIAGVVSAYLPFYQARAHFIRTGRADEFIGEKKNDWMEKLGYAAFAVSRGDTRGINLQLAKSVSSLIALQDEHICALFSVAAQLVSTNQATFDNREAEILRPFCWRPEAYGLLTEFAEERESKISNLKTSSSEKASALLQLSRLLLDCSPHTSASLFNSAVLVLSDIDINEMRLLGTFEKLSKVASSTFDSTASRKAAIGLSTFGTAVAFRLRDYDHFPWHQLSRAIARLSAPVALGAAARWDDENLVASSVALEAVLQTAVHAGSIPAGSAAACCYLFDQASDSLLSEILNAATLLDTNTRQTVHEILAECEALASSPNPRFNIDTAIIRGVPVAERQRWVTYLADRSKFAGVSTTSESSHTYELIPADASQKEALRSFLDSLDWHSGNLDSAAGISDFTRHAYTEARKKHSLYSIDRELFQRIRKTVPAHRRFEHLSQLAELILMGEAAYDLIDALTEAIVEWHELSVAVRDWCSLNLPKLISTRLLAFMVVMRDKAPLARLIEVECMTTGAIYQSILAGLAENIEEFDAAKIYDLVEVIVELVPADKVGAVLDCYVDRVVARVHEEDQPDPADIPSCIDGALARLFYAYLSDASLTVRWRAAHAVRSLFWLEASDVTDELVSRYNILSETSFRATGAPFYWLAARLWLTIAISRACTDRPTFAARYANYLFSVLEDVTFPHVIVRTFAKQGAMALANAGALQLTKQQREAIFAVDGSTLPKKERPRDLSFEDDRTMGAGQQRNFHFDALDTLRYWYPGMARIFANISLKDFVDEAERWIVDRWGVKTNPWKWDEETRRDKFKHDPYAMSHSHGELPRVERFNTHLEWHAMWCTTGELLKSHPLTKSDYGDDRLHEEVRAATTISPTLWLSDLRSPKPLEERFWIPPRVGGNWVQKPSVNEVVALLGIEEPGDWCFVHGDYDRYWLGLHETVHVSSCLVGPQAAPALLRALQSSTSSHAHYLPRAGDDEDGIDMPPFKLKGWLRHLEQRVGLDSKDDFAADISPGVIQPGEAVRQLLKLVPSDRFIYGWEHGPTSDLVFYSERWADKIPDRRFRNEADFVRSKGERLHCKRQWIAQVLRQEQCDLLIKVQTYRKEYEETLYSENEQGESAYFNRYLILTAQGFITDATGHIGTWKAIS